MHTCNYDETTKDSRNLSGSLICAIIFCSFSKNVTRYKIAVLAQKQCWFNSTLWKNILWQKNTCNIFISQECLYDTILYIWVICMNIMKFFPVLLCSRNGIPSYNSATMIQWLRCKNLCKKDKKLFCGSHWGKISNDMLANILLRRNFFIV